jgi:glycosyltransferase involved in cell wall biosynthesis
MDLNQRPASDLKINKMASPILSICIPTFNRAHYLDNLFASLLEVKIAFKKEVQICVSNNFSTDNTSSTIEKWSERLELNVVTQTSNIGGTRNAVEVTRLATGKWNIIVGDDDIIIRSGLSVLIDYLSVANEDDWILAGVADHTGAEHLLNSVCDGYFAAKEMQIKLLQTGIYKYGFVGMHIFPNKFVQLLQGLLINDIQPWAHLAIFLRHISSGFTKIIIKPMVAQAAGGYNLYWSPRDWALINLKKINIIHRAKIEINKNCFFYNLLMLRELYSLKALKAVILWKALESKFNWREANREYILSYQLVGILSFLCIFHYLFILFIIITPQSIVKLLFRICGRYHILDKHRAVKEKYSVFDGVQRGI